MASTLRTNYPMCASRTPASNTPNALSHGPIANNPPFTRSTAGACATAQFYAPTTSNTASTQTSARNRKSTTEDPLAETLKNKTLATIGSPKTMTFSLQYLKQDDSLLDRAPAEIRNMIYELCGAKDGRLHLYKLSKGIKAFNCEGYDLTQPCLGTAPCHIAVEKQESTFPEERRHYQGCPTSCKQHTPTNFLALSMTCQKFYLETLNVNYQSNMFVVSKYVFANILVEDNLANKHTLSAGLTRIQRLQLDLGVAKYAALVNTESKYATLRAVLKYATALREFAVRFTTVNRGLLRYPIDDGCVSILSRFRGLTKFTLVVGTHVETPPECAPNREKERHAEFVKAVPLIGDTFEKFVTLRDLDDMTGLTKMEMKMAKDGKKFVVELKKKVKFMLTGK